MHHNTSNLLVNINVPWRHFKCLQLSLIIVYLIFNHHNEIKLFLSIIKFKKVVK